MKRDDLPAWWRWDLDISPHALKRMVSRQFNETDLRLMLDSVTRLQRDIGEGRWVVHTRHDHRPWVVIVEPDEESALLVVVTAYAVGADQ